MKLRSTLERGRSLKRNFENRNLKLEEIVPPDSHPEPLWQWIMPLSMCFHCIGYEAARSTSIALLSSKEIGLGTEGLSKTISIGTPVNALILYVWAISSKCLGSAITLRCLHFTIILVLSLMFYWMRTDQIQNGKFGQHIVVLFYIFRESYVGIMSTLQWGFLVDNFSLFRCVRSPSPSPSDSTGTSHVIGTSTGTDSLVYDGRFWTTFFPKHDKSNSNYPEKSNWIVFIGGVTSFASVLGSIALYFTVTKGLDFLFGCSVLFSILSWLLSEKALHIRDKYLYQIDSSRSRSRSRSQIRKRAPTESSAWIAIFHDGINLFINNKILVLLLLEAIFHQSASNMLNIQFHDTLRTNILDDNTRILLVSNFFMTCNFFVCLMQMFIAPKFLTIKTLPYFLVFIPITILLTCLWSYMFPSLYSILLTFGTMKVLEFSILTSAMELIFLSMNEMTSDMKCFGKELIRFCGHKLGKTGTSIMIGTAITMYSPSSTQQSAWGCFLLCIWGFMHGFIANHLLEGNGVDGMNNINKNDDDDYDNNYKIQKKKNKKKKH
jgi:hypothetical protein